MNCKKFQSELPELVLSPATASNADLRAHLAECSPCESEYTSLVATLALMDAWQAPPPSAYFDQKLAVLLREEIAAPKLGLFARLRDHVLFNTGRQFRPAMTGALVMILVLGGGGYASFENANHTSKSPQISATVNDLQILDKDEQALQTMDQLLQDDEKTDDSGANAPS